MAQQIINIGDTGLEAKNKINDNFQELYNLDYFDATVGVSATGADYTTITEAKAVSGINRVKLLSNITDTFTIDKYFIIDFNSFTITGDVTIDYANFIYSNYSLTGDLINTKQNNIFFNCRVKDIDNQTDGTNATYYSCTYTGTFTKNGTGLKIINGDGEQNEFQESINIPLTEAYKINNIDILTLAENKEILQFSSGFVTSKEIRFSDLTTFISIDNEISEIDSLVFETRIPGGTTYTTRADLSALNTYSQGTSDFYLKITATFDVLYFGQSDVVITYKKYAV